MPVTPDHDLTYPNPDDAPNGPRQVQQLALDVDQALTGLLVDTGVQAGLDVTPAAGWQVTARQYRLIGKKMYLRLETQRTGANITADTTGAGNAPGNIADTVIATINDVQLRPAFDTYGLFRGSITSGSCQVGADGRVWIVDMHSNSSIRTNDTVNISMPYPIP
ncbi:MAG: hypothetical protein J2P24_00320 [Streptosporangiales bacterium]|nr:hypothetical protein [Streptosporangiales bacterium]